MRQNGRADDDADTPQEEEYSNAQLQIVTSQYQPAFIVEFRNIFPVSLTNMQFDARVSDIEYMTAEVTFKHQQFFIKDKNLQTIT